MSLKTTNWRIQQNNSASLIRTLVLVAAVTPAICLILINSNHFNTYRTWLILATITSAFLPLAFIKKYLTYRKLEHFIILSSKILTIPTPMMKDRTIDLSKIKSLEALGDSKKAKGLWMGLLDGSSEFVDANFFESQDAFEDFTRKLVIYTEKFSINPSNKNTEDLRIKLINNNDKAMRCVAASIFAVYATTTASELKEITEKAVEIGALTKTALQFPEIYKIASSFFLHSDINHLILNTFCLIFIGRNIEIILGKLRFSGILFGSAFFGALLSLIYSKADYVIGASGGIMGLLGTYSVLCLKYQHCIPGSVSTPARRIIFIIFAQIISDVLMKGVDIFSHAGGFLFGSLYAIFLLQEMQPNVISSPSKIENVTATAIGFLYFIGLTYFLFSYL